MRFKYFGLAILTLSLFVAGNFVSAEEISKEESQRLTAFFQNKFATQLPPGASVEVIGYEDVAIEGVKKGTFKVTIPNGTQELGFLIGEDGKLILLGSMADLNTFEATEIKGLKKGSIGSSSILATDDGKHLIIGGEIVPLSGLEKTELGGVKKGSVTRGGQATPIFSSSNGQYLILAIDNIIDTTIDPTQEVMEKISLDDVPFKGAADAKVIVVEYSDFQCPYCKRGKDMLPTILKEYDGEIKVIFKQYPLPMHPWAQPAAIASLCVYEQGNDKFWDFHDMVFDNQRQITVENASEMFSEYAKELGVDTAKYDACVKSDKTAKKVAAEIAETKAIGFGGTPTFIVNGIVVEGANLAGLKSAIELKLSEGS